MAYTETVLRVFVASPSDLSDERVKIAEIIDDINRTVAKSYQLRVELLTWENSTSPSIDTEAQAVINRQIGDTYDIFIGLMWTKFGSPTLSYTSGTEEEFYKAKERFENKQGIFDIMFYFKNEGVDLSSIDPSQLMEVQEFKKKLGSEGVYYWNFTTLENFERNFRTHFWMKLKDFNEKRTIKIENLETQLPLVEPEELGLFDIAESMEDDLKSLTIILSDLVDHTNWIGEQIRTHTAETNTLNKNSLGNPSRSDSVKIINNAAGDLETYAKFVKDDREKFSTTINKVIKNSLEMFSISEEINQLNSTEYISYIQNFKTMKESLSSALGGLQDYISTISQMPRMTSRLNASRRHVVTECTALSNDMNQAVGLIDELIAKHGDF